jgi:protein-disulfide isomerase
LPDARPKGSAKATVTLVEYADYECPFCGRYGAEVYPQIDRDYIKTNKVQYVFKNYPIAQLHPASFKAHVAAACAGDQRRYWEMHDKLYTDRKTVTPSRVLVGAQPYEAFKEAIDAMLAQAAAGTR